MCNLSINQLAHIFLRSSIFGLLTFVTQYFIAIPLLLAPGRSILWCLLMIALCVFVPAALSRFLPGFRPMDVFLGLIIQGILWFWHHYFLMCLVFDHTKCWQMPFDGYLFLFPLLTVLWGACIAAGQYGLLWIWNQKSLCVSLPDELRRGLKKLCRGAVWCLLNFFVQCFVLLPGLEFLEPTAFLWTILYPLPLAILGWWLWKWIPGANPSDALIGMVLQIPLFLLNGESMVLLVGFGLSTGTFADVNMLFYWLFLAGSCAAVFLGQFLVPLVAKVWQTSKAAK